MSLALRKRDIPTCKWTNRRTKKLPPIGLPVSGIDAKADHLVLSFFVW